MKARQHERTRWKCDLAMDDIKPSTRDNHQHSKTLLASVESLTPTRSSVILSGKKRAEVKLTLFRFHFGSFE